MRKLDGLMGKLGKFFVQYKDYLEAREVLIKYHLNKKKKVYNGFGRPYIPKEVVDAEFTILNWKNRRVK